MKEIQAGEPVFGTPDPDADYTPREAAYGVLSDPIGRVALVAIGSGRNLEYDLPGGAVEAGETVEDALVREFGEETGLEVKPGHALGTAWHYWHRPDGKRIFNHAHFFEVTSVSESAAKIEADHTLIWGSLADCIARLRHEASAWALTRWVRINGSGYPRSSG